jgi:outer membrane protein TolC
MHILWIIIFSSLAQAELTSLEIVDLIVKNNSKVKLAKLDLELAIIEKDAANKDKDWNIGIASFVENVEENKNSTIDLAKVLEKTTGLSFGVTKKLKYGTTFDVSYQTLKITSDSINAVSPKRHQGTGKITITQPLLSGRSPSVNIEKKIKAPYKIKRYESRLESAIEKEVKKAITIGIDLLEKKEELKIKNQSLKYYQRVAKYNKKSYRNGKISKADHLDAKAKLMREEALIKQSKSKIINLEYKLLKQITPVNENIFSQLHKVKNLNFTGLQKDLDLSSLAEAPRIKEKLWQMEEDKATLKAAKNQLLPILDLKLEYSASGINNEYSESLSQVTGKEFPELAIGLNFVWKFGNNTNKGRLDSSRSIVNRRRYESQKIKLDEEKKWGQAKANLDEINTLEKYSLARKKNEDKKLVVKRKMYRQGMISYIDFGKVLIDYEDFQIGLLRSRIRRLKEYLQIRLLSRYYL